MLASDSAQSLSGDSLDTIWTVGQWFGVRCVTAQAGVICYHGPDISLGSPGPGPVSAHPSDHTPLMAHITSHTTSPASDWSAWPRLGMWLADSPGCCSHHATQRGLTPNCKLRFLGVGRLGTLEMGSPLSQTGLRRWWTHVSWSWEECEARRQITGTHESQHRREMFAKYCHLSVIHLTVTTVYFHLGVSVRPQTTSCYVLIKVFAKREERERGETGVTWDLGCGQARSERE